jgi:hypothetical protein
MDINPIITGLPFVGLCSGGLIALLIAVFVATDANKRGMNGLIWGLFTFLFCIPVLPLYLVIRKPVGYVGPPVQTYPPPPVAGVPPAPPERMGFCARCGAELQPGAKFCGTCGTSV